MPVGERVKVDSSDVHSYYSRGFTVIFGKLIITCKKMTLSGELYGCFQMKFCIGAVILIRSLCLEFGELSVMPRY
ncbi:hypothetical protein Goshw_001180 [Gossypium schwendimanii]|uniref:Uncharacterized protein n=1 Tax=Gossypium schwendimanii TaxID=34291 RepID=A0A7J9N5B2_GOSSC|nr:hypothetical protein [Gossypium schwendimanii]